MIRLLYYQIISLRFIKTIKVWSEKNDKDLPNDWKVHLALKFMNNLSEEITKSIVSLKIKEFNNFISKINEIVDYYKRPSSKKKG